MSIHKEVFAILREAGDAVLFHYKKQFKTEFKKDHSPVTEIDLLSDKIICSSLKILTPNIPIISEESQHTDSTDSLQNFWLVDPIDGTKGYIIGNDHFAINIALMENQKPKYGFILLPVTGEIFYNDDYHAYILKPGSAPKIISCRNIPDNGLDVLASSSYGIHTIKFLNQYKIRSITKIGSAIKFCHIAAGLADLYVRHGQTMEWDTAAGESIIKKAGGHLLSIDGTPMIYGKKDFKNKSFITYGAGILHKS